MSFDTKCYELAEYFVPDLPARKLEELAQRIQDAIEDFTVEEGPVE